MCVCVCVTMMSLLHHADVLSPWIVLEYMEHGDLKSFLTVCGVICYDNVFLFVGYVLSLSLQNNQRSTSQLVKYMVDVAMGMHYISERGLVHRVCHNKLAKFSQHQKCIHLSLIVYTLHGTSFSPCLHIAWNLLTLSCFVVE